MDQEPRKATDVLLDLESKLIVLLDLVRTQDLSIKILSNKFNEVMARLEKVQNGPPRVIVETTAPPIAPPMPSSFTQLPAGFAEKTVPIVAEANLPQDNSPQGFRRNSRPETYVGGKNVAPVVLGPPPQAPSQGPQPPPGRQGTANPPPGRMDAQVPPAAAVSGPIALPPPMTNVGMAQQPMPVSAQGQIPVMQRCVDKNGKSIFLADVSIVDIATEQPVSKTRTNGTGKWAAPLGIGSYRITVRKQGSSIKEKIEAVQEIHVDGSQSPLDLPMMIIK
jgi:hypothetical protein